MYGICTLVLYDDVSTQKYSRLRCLLRVNGLVIFFYLGWSCSILQIRNNILKVGSKSCSSNITLSLPSYTGSALKRELNFCNGYLSLLYSCSEYTRYLHFYTSSFVTKGSTLFSVSHFSFNSRHFLLDLIPISDFP